MELCKIIGGQNEVLMEICLCDTYLPVFVEK